MISSSPKQIPFSDFSLYYHWQQYPFSHYYPVFWFFKIFLFKWNYSQNNYSFFSSSWICDFVSGIFQNISTATILSSCHFDHIIEITMCIVFLSPFFNQTDTKIHTLKHFVDQNLLNKLQWLSIFCYRFNGELLKFLRQVYDSYKAMFYHVNLPCFIGWVEWRKTGF